MKVAQIILLNFVIIFLTACGVTKPNLANLYAIEERQVLGAAEKFQPPVVVVPGIVSSTLVDEKGKEVWFGPIRKLFFSDYDLLALDIDPVTLTAKPSNIKAGILPRKVLGQDFYGSLFDILENYGNYKHTEIGTPYENGRRYYKFAYDWRYDNIKNIAKLDAFIDQIRKDYGMPDLQVDIVAHSMGGLLARYYMRYGTLDVLDDNDFPINQAGAKKVRRLVQLGAPNLGTVSALHELLEGYKIVFGRVAAETLLTMPSVYQLLPHPLNQWIINIQGEPLRRDLYDAEIWQRFQWGPYDPKLIKRIKSKYKEAEQGDAQVALLQRYFEKHIERARRFVWSLSVKIPEPEFSIVAFGGNCQPTPARILVEEVEGESVVRLWPKEIKNPLPDINYERLMLEPGDGRVTKPSMLARDFLNPAVARHKYSFIPLDYAFFLCHGHGRLTGNVNFQDNLLNVLLEQTHEEMRDKDS